MSLERATRLRPSRGALDNHVSQLRIGGASASQIVLLPYSQGLGYFIVPTGGPMRSIEGDDFHAGAAQPAAHAMGPAAAHAHVQEEEIPPIQ